MNLYKKISEHCWYPWPSLTISVKSFKNLFLTIFTVASSHILYLSPWQRTCLVKIFPMNEHDSGRLWGFASNQSLNKVPFDIWGIGLFCHAFRHMINSTSIRKYFVLDSFPYKLYFFFWSSENPDQSSFTTDRLYLILVMFTWYVIRAFSSEDKRLILKYNTKFKSRPWRGRAPNPYSVILAVTK